MVTDWEMIRRTVRIGIEIMEAARSVDPGRNGGQVDCLAGQCAGIGIRHDSQVGGIDGARSVACRSEIGHALSRQSDAVGDVIDRLAIGPSEKTGSSG